jgi:hypothetical protein
MLNVKGRQQKNGAVSRFSLFSMSAIEGRDDTVQHGDQTPSPACPPQRGCQSYPLLSSTDGVAALKERES